MPSLLPRSDVIGMGHSAAVAARDRPDTDAAVIGDGAVGLCDVVAPKRLDAERITPSRSASSSNLRTVFDHCGEVHLSLDANTVTTEAFCASLEQRSSTDVGGHYI